MSFKKLLLVGIICFGLILSGGTLQAQRKMTQIKGSDTLVNLVQILAEEYMAKNPRSPIAVLGGGSGTGIAALINGTCDIANHSRPMKDKEVQMAKDKGVTPHVFIIAVDGLSVILNESNPISKLTMEQIGAIYRGEIKNWREVGGPNKAISLYGRQSNSGTYVFFQEHVLKKQNYSDSMMRMNGNAQIVEGVTQDKYGIGYVGVGYVVDAQGNVKNGIKILNVSRDGNSKAYSPLNKAAVDSGDYPIARPLFQSTAGAPEGAILDFIKFEISPEGQKIVEREGFFPIGSSHQAENNKNLK
ncbi:MAG: PstS family phosphate ABC transporter substrate-binding protein [Candidatus Aminicenantes bacterium]|jgi:phosphate transport system substrate-binding protein